MTTAFIIVALGAPKDFEGRSVKKFLREFLSDKRVVPLPYVPRRIIAELAAQLRWRKYSRDMRMIAVDGEPSVRHYAKNILASLREAMPNDIVEVAFRYPNLSDAVERARSRGAKKFCFLPLCPHNSRSITQSARAAALETMRPGDVFEFCQSYCSHPMYIDAVADSVPSDLEKDSILFIGSLYPQKGLGTLLNAYKRVGAYKKLPRLDIIGAGSEFANVEKWIRENKLSDKIFLRGAVYDIDKKAEYFARAIACVSPCQAGLAVQESMGYGVCFATNSDSFTGGERFDIVHGQTGILFSENYGIGDFLAELADRPERFINIGKSAKNFYDRFRKPSNMVDGLWKAVEYAYNKRVIGAELK